ncbi:MAG: hypothetical protein DRI94_14780 [Bacteroidetes bacterium]|nr:MAG: hypothetical protein DRI94_14780 [Bacteroidota bacterium]
MVATKSLSENYMSLILQSIKSENPISKLKKNNKESLKEMIKFLSRLNKKNQIDEKQFEELVTLVCANFIENEVELRIEKTISNKIMFFFDKF